MYLIQSTLKPSTIELSYGILVGIMYKLLPRLLSETHQIFCVLISHYYERLPYSYKWTILTPINQTQSFILNEIVDFILEAIKMSGMFIREIE